MPRVKMYSEFLIYDIHDDLKDIKDELNAGDMISAKIIVDELIQEIEETILQQNIKRG